MNKFSRDRVAAPLIVLALVMMNVNSAETAPVEKLPKDLKDFALSKAVELLDPDKVVEVDLGELRTASGYRVTIPLTNISGSRLEIKSVSSSCGCIVGVQRELSIPVGGSGEIQLIIIPMQRAGDFRKLVKLVDVTGHSWSLGIKASVSSMFKISPSKVSTDAGDVSFVVKPADSGVDVSQFDVESQTGFLVISEALRESSDKRELHLNARLAHGVGRSLTTLVERLVVRNRLNHQSSEILVAIEPLNSVGLRPDNLRLKLDGEEFSGTAIMMGRMERLASFKSGRLVFEDRDLEGQVEVKGRSKSVIQVQIVFHVNEGMLKDLTEIRNGLIIDQDGATVCAVDRLTFLSH